MRVILLHNIKGVGQIGDIRDVSDGYGRNFLLPRKLARAAIGNALKEAEQLKKKLKEIRELESKQALAIAEKLKGTVLELREKANPAGKLFAAVTRKEIAEKLKAATGYEVGDESVKIKEHSIKTVGEHSVELELTPDVTVLLHVVVLAESGTRRSS